MRAAVYCGTRNLYQHMVTAAKSLLMHSNVEKIYFLIQDDVFPYQLPQIFECINVSNQQYFRKDGPNFNSVFTYMVLLRVAFTKIFPHLEKILSIDVDTVVNENISELWDLDLTNYYIAAVKEKINTPHPDNINAGIMMINLKKLRQDKKDDQLIQKLNTNKYTFCQQECINEYCKDFIYELPPDYNINYTIKQQQLKHEKILHYIAVPVEKWSNYPTVLYYKNIPLNNIQRNKSDQIKLDIIIPFYNQIEDLYYTLDSIPKSTNIQITIIDDCSDVNYQEEVQYYRKDVNFFRLETNVGPGAVRQFGIEHTNGTHIMFLDSGDQLLSQYNLLEILETIKHYPFIYIFCWRALKQKDHTYFGPKIVGPLHGNVFKRQFLDLYNIRFSRDKECSYINQDIGFTNICHMALAQNNKYEILSRYKLFDSVIQICTYNGNSLTNKNNNFLQLKQIPGLAYNAIYVYNYGIQNNIDINILYQQISKLMLSLYYWFLMHIRDNIFEQSNWQAIKKYYFLVIKPNNHLQLFNQIFNRVYKDNFRSFSDVLPNNYHINIKQFLKQLEENEKIPERYFKPIKDSNFIKIQNK